MKQGGERFVGWIMMGVDAWYTTPFFVWYPVLVFIRWKVESKKFEISGRIKKTFSFVISHSSQQRTREADLNGNKNTKTVH